jgi:hypothetical protein
MRKGQGKQFHSASNKKLWSILFWVPPSMQQFAAFFFSPCCFSLVVLLVVVRGRGYRSLQSLLYLLLELFVR